MKREDVSKIFDGATDEQINALLDINSADIGKVKKESENLEKDLKTANATITTITEELKTLKESNASSEDWKAKFEKLQNTVAENERLVKEQKAAEEKQNAIINRFNAVCVGKDGKPLEFAHEAIKADYVRKFGEALDDKDNVGKSDADVFHALTKDDGSAFKGVQQQINLKGGQLGGFGSNEPDELGKLDMQSYIAARKQMKG